MATFRKVRATGVAGALAALPATDEDEDVEETEWRAEMERQTEKALEASFEKWLGGDDWQHVAACDLPLVLAFPLRKHSEADWKTEVKHHTPCIFREDEPINGPNDGWDETWSFWRCCGYGDKRMKYCCSPQVRPRDDNDRARASFYLPPWHRGVSLDLGDLNPGGCPWQPFAELDEWIQKDPWERGEWRVNQSGVWRVAFDRFASQKGKRKQLAVARARAGD